ncbi:hypothetical protein Ahia01_001179000, partial [Argonauta hians]
MYTMGEVMVNHCTLCYCGPQGTMVCHTLCEGKDRKVVYTGDKRDDMTDPSVVCATFSYITGCSKKMQAEPMPCWFQNYKYTNGIYVWQNYIVLCNENGTQTILGNTICPLCDPIMGCFYNKHYMRPGPIDSSDCSCIGQGIIKCRSDKSKPEVPYGCFFRRRYVPFGPIKGTGCDCKGDGMVMCTPISRPGIIPPGYNPKVKVT